MSKKYELLENEYVTKILAISSSLDANTIVWQEVITLLLFYNKNLIIKTLIDTSVYDVIITI